MDVSARLLWVCIGADALLFMVLTRACPTPQTFAHAAQLLIELISVREESAYGVYDDTPPSDIVLDMHQYVCVSVSGGRGVDEARRGGGGGGGGICAERDARRFHAFLGTCQDTPSYTKLRNL